MIQETPTSSKKMCECGKTLNSPYCDGSHSKIKYIIDGKEYLLPKEEYEKIIKQIGEDDNIQPQ